MNSQELYNLLHKAYQPKFEDTDANTKSKALNILSEYIYKHKDNLENKVKKLEIIFSVKAGSQDDYKQKLSDLIISRFWE